MAPLVAAPRGSAHRRNERLALYLVCPQITKKTNLLPDAESNAIKLKQHFEALSPAFIRHSTAESLPARILLTAVLWCAESITDELNRAQVLGAIESFLAAPDVDCFLLCFVGHGIEGSGDWVLSDGVIDFQDVFN